MRGARINVMNRGDDTPLHLAASHGHRDIVQKVPVPVPARALPHPLCTSPHYPTSPVRNTPAPLSSLLLTNSLQIPEPHTTQPYSTQCAAPASPWTRHKEDGDCPGLMGMLPGLTGTVPCPQLMQFKADINAVNEHGNTPLHYACFWGHEQVAEVSGSMGRREGGVAGGLRGDHKPQSLLSAPTGPGEQRGPGQHC